MAYYKDAIKYSKDAAEKTPPRRVLCGVEPWESKVDGTMAFFDQTSLIPSAWFKVKSFAYCEEVISHCEHEISCNISQLDYLDNVEIAPIMVASVDIECYSKSGGFPRRTT